MIDDFAKDYLHQDLRWVRQSMLGQSTICPSRDPSTDDVNRHESARTHQASDHDRDGVLRRDLRPEPHHGRIPVTTSRAIATGTRCGSPSRSRAQTSSTATSAPGRTLTPPSTRCRSTRSDSYPWWPEPTVRLFNVMIHVLTETNRHAGHADILREQLNERNGLARMADASDWDSHRALIERAARRAGAEPDPHIDDAP